MEFVLLRRKCVMKSVVWSFGIMLIELLGIIRMMGMNLLNYPMRLDAVNCHLTNLKLNQNNW